MSGERQLRINSPRQRKNRKSGWPVDEAGRAVIILFYRVIHLCRGAFQRARKCLPSLPAGGIEMTLDLIWLCWHRLVSLFNRYGRGMAIEGDAARARRDC
jgi:hypothetical protein